MGISTATLNGNKVTESRSSIPAWGAAYHDVAIDGEVTLTGAVTLVVADLSFACTVLSGGPAQGRSFYRLVAGAGGWGKTLPKRSYTNDIGVKLITVLNDAAQAVGETIDQTSVDTGARLGPFFVRPEGPACRILEQVAPSAWYIGEDGKTRLGARPAATLDVSATRTTQIDKARGTVTLASDSIIKILPGLSVDGINSVDVEHEINHKTGLRSKLWGKLGSTSRRLSAWRAMLDQLDPDRKFRGTYEYRIVIQTGERLSLQPVRVSTGMPDLLAVYVRPGVPGCKATHHLGARVLVSFIDADPTRPAVVAFEDADGAGYTPSVLKLDASSSVLLAGGGDFLIPASWATDGTHGLVKALTTLASALGTATTFPNVNAAGTALGTAIPLLPPAATTKTKAT